MDSKSKIIKDKYKGIEDWHHEDIEQYLFDAKCKAEEIKCQLENASVLDDGVWYKKAKHARFMANMEVKFLQMSLNRQISNRKDARVIFGQRNVIKDRDRQIANMKKKISNFHQSEREYKAKFMEMRRIIGEEEFIKMSHKVEQEYRLVQ